MPLHYLFMLYYVYNVSWKHDDHDETLSCGNIEGILPENGNNMNNLFAE